MKNTKNTLLSIAIIAALPFSAKATQTVVETNTPAAVGANGTVKKAAATGPYQTATIGEHDDEHIATTAYVKGAYNDAIAAVNKVNSDKQDDLGLSEVMGTVELVNRVLAYTFNNDNDAIANISGKAVTAEGVITTLRDYNTTLQDATLPILLSDKQSQLTTTVNNQSQDISSTVAQTVNTTTPSATTLVSEAAIASAINGVTTNLSTNYATNTALNSKRVEIYTTWGVDDGTATALVPFATAQ